MTKYKKILSILLAGTMLVASGISGCGNGQDTSDQDNQVVSDGETPEDGAEENNGAGNENTDDNTAAGDITWDSGKKDEIVLTVINNYYTAGQKKAAEEYTKLHPETTVVVDVVSDNDAYVTKMRTSFGEDGNKDNAPDIVHGNFLAAALTGGNMSVAFEKEYLMDLMPMLDEVNPYNEGKLVRDAFEEQDLVKASNSGGGSKMSMLPFDHVGVAFFYNKDIFEAEGLAVPNTFEELEAICETLREKGYENPIAAGSEASWFMDAIADAGYRNIEEQFIVQPGDAIWDESTMKANENFKFDESDMACDEKLINSDERMLAYKKDNGAATALNTTVYESFVRIAKYFPENWIQADTSQMITDFETGRSPMLLQGSFNAGLILADVNMLPEDKQFDWATFQFPSFENAPEGFSNTLRGLYVFGNVISIVQKDDADHMERVKDFYKYMYSPDGARLLYEETLNNGNLVQGPSAIKGVELSPELQEKMDGFVPEGIARTFDRLTGFKMVSSADMPKFYDLINRLCDGSITADQMLNELQPMYDAYNEEAIRVGGYDLDPTTPDTAAE